MTAADPKRVTIATILSAALPGAGHLLLGGKIAGAAILAACLLGSSGAIWHLTAGISLFESYLGSFLFGALLRGLMILATFAVFDVYLRGTGQGEPRRRSAVLANLLVPGSGYLVARAWLRAATGLAVLTAIVFFARGPNRFLDLIFVGAQAIMGFGVYHQMLTEQLQKDRDQRPAPARQVPSAQVALLVIGMAAAIGFGWVVMKRMPDYGRVRVSAEQVTLVPRDGALSLAVSSLGLRMKAHGKGWINASHRPGVILSARHALGATLLVGAEPIVPFVSAARYALQVKRRITEVGYGHERSRSLSIGGLPARQMRFSKRVGPMSLDRWAIVIPRGEIALIIMFGCRRAVCKKLERALEKTRDSVRFVPEK